VKVLILWFIQVRRSDFIPFTLESRTYRRVEGRGI